MTTRKRISLSTAAKTLLIVSALLSLVVVSWLRPLPGEAGKTGGDGPRLVPRAMMKWPETGSQYAVLVDKSQQKVFLYHKEDPFRPEKVYRCSTGENDGRKSRQNDRRTPEGIYFFTKSYVEKYLTPIYGVRAFPIDYPNPIDQKEGRDGYGIWFHGTNKDLKPKDTNGCIVMENSSIDDLASYIKLHETPAIISSSIEMADPKTLKEETATLEGMIEEWRKAWERKDLDRYITFYSSRFRSGGKDREAWKEYKSRLARQYREIQVGVDNIRLLRNGDTVLAEFTQNYRASAFKSVGVKRLYLQQNSTEWKIIDEVFNGRDKTLIAAPESPPSPDKEIRTFIYRWRTAWRTKDIKSYMSCYAPDFESRGMDRLAWRRHRQKLNRKYATLEIDIRGLKLAQVSTHEALVTFHQDYRADDYHDVGLKELFLVKKGRMWKIKKEEWQPLEGTSRR